MSAFLAAHPNVSVDLEERLSDEIVGLIAEGVGDIGIVAGTVDAGRLTTYPFRSDRFVLVVARDHPLAQRPKIAFAEVLDHDFVGLDRASALQRFLASKAAHIGRPLRLRVQLRSFDAVCRLVECNVGVGVVPETTARRAIKSMAIKAVDLTDPWALRELTICIRDFAALAALCAPAGRAHAGAGELATGSVEPTARAWLWFAGRSRHGGRTMRIAKLLGTAGAAALLAAAVVDAGARPPKWPTPSSRTPAARRSATPT